MQAAGGLRIHTLKSYIDEEPEDYIDGNVGEARILQQAMQQQNVLQNSLTNPDYLQSQNLTNVPEDFDLDEFLQKSIYEINNQIVGNDRQQQAPQQYLPNQEPPEKVITQTTLQQNSLATHLAQQKSDQRGQQHRRVQTLDDILKQSINKIDFISEQCQQQFNEGDVEQYKLDEQFRRRRENLQCGLTKIGQNKQVKIGGVQQINEQVTKAQEYAKNDLRLNVEPEQSLQQCAGNEASLAYDPLFEQTQHLPNHNPRMVGLAKTRDCNDNFKYIAHRIPAMRADTLESRYMDGIRQGTRYTATRTTVQPAYRKNAPIANKFASAQDQYLQNQQNYIHQELKKSQSWLNSNLNLGIDASGMISGRQTTGQQYRSSLQLVRQNMSSQQRGKTNNVKQSPSTLKNDQFSHIQSQYSQEKLKQQNFAGNQSRSASRALSAQNSRQISRSTSKNSSFEQNQASKSQIVKSQLRQKQLMTPQSLQQGMRNNILSKQLQIVKPKQDDAIYYRQVLQKQLQEQRLQKQRMEMQRQQESNEQFTYHPQITQRPPYLDSMQTTPKSERQSERHQVYTRQQQLEDEEYLESQIQQLNEQLRSSRRSSFRGGISRSRADDNIVNTRARGRIEQYVQNKVQYKNVDAAQAPPPRRSIQPADKNTYTPRITVMRQDAMSNNLKHYLQQPVYDRLAGKYIGSRAATPQAQNHTPKAASQRVDFQGFLNRQAAKQQEKVDRINLKRMQLEEQAHRMANQPKTSKQSELYLKYRNILRGNLSETGSRQMALPISDRNRVVGSTVGNRDQVYRGEDWT